MLEELLTEVALLEWRAQDPLAGLRLHATATFNQVAFRFREDDGSETAATWLAAENVDPTSFDVTTDHHLRLRIAIQETAGGATNNVDFTLQYQINGGTWTSVDASANEIVYIGSSFVADQTPTTDQLTTPTGAFASGAFISAPASLARISFAGSDNGENEYSLNLIAADLADGDVINFRLLNNGAVMAAYSQTPTVVVSKTAPIPSGSASGSHSWAGSASGSRTSQGNASGSYSFAGSASGSLEPNGSSTGSYSWVGAASGTTPAEPIPSGSSSGSYSFTGAASGSIAVAGSANGDYSWTGTASGQIDLSGSANGSYSFVGEALGTTPPINPRSGSASGSYSFAGSALGSIDTSGSASGSYSLLGAANGSITVSGSASGSYLFVGSAAGPSLIPVRDVVLSISDPIGYDLTLSLLNRGLSSELVNKETHTMADVNSKWAIEDPTVDRI